MLLASGGVLVRYLLPRTSRERRVLVRADITDIPVNGALVFKTERVALMRTENRFSALSLVCTHLGCTVNVTENSLACPCHGSIFDRQGAVIKGPAGRALSRLEWTEQDGIITVYRS